jgi:hypothetical protein
MVMRELIKAEIDKVQDQYLEVLYRIVQALTDLPEQVAVVPQGTVETSWQEFVRDTFGSLANDPIERGEQGQYEVREADDDELRDEYDLSKLPVMPRGRYAPEYHLGYSEARPGRFAEGSMVVVLEPELAQVYKTPERVKAILEAIARAMPPQET